MSLPVETLILILFAGFLAWETDLENPKPYPLGNGDTLMIRITGYEFCPKDCDINHFHIGHFEGYDCEYDVCNHTTIDEN